MGRKLTATRLFAAGTRRVTAVVSLVWLNLAMLPCAMAVETDHSCPSCPPGHEQGMVAHHAEATSDDEPSCAVAQPDCCELDQISFDDRPQKSEKDDGEKPPLIVDLEFTVTSAVSPQRQFATGPPELYGGRPRLHVLHCVYLD